jgi:DNA-binding protein HU-beta
LAALGIAQLRRSVAEVAAQVIDGRADARTIQESVAGLESAITQATTAATGPLVHAVERVRTQVDAIPAPDLAALCAPLDEVRAAVREQAEATQAVAEQVAVRADQGDVVDAVRDELSAAQATLQASIDRLAAGVAATRGAPETGRRPAGRWGRGRKDEAAPRRPEPRIDQALHDVDARLDALAQLVERAATLADDVAQAALATLRAVTSPPPTAAVPAGSGARSRRAPVKRDAAKAGPKKVAAKATPPKTAASKKPTRKKTAVKKVPVKKAPVKKAAPATRAAKRPPT